VLRLDASWEQRVPTCDPRKEKISGSDICTNPKHQGATTKTKNVKLPKKNNASKSTPAATFRMTLQNPFLRGEDLQYVYRKVLIISSLHLSLVVSGSSQPRLTIRLDHQVNHLAKNLNSTQKIINRESLATSISQDLTWRPHWRSNNLGSIVSPKPVPSYSPVTTGQISRTRFIFKGGRAVTSQI
jgi:hypothetical protein